MSLVNLIYFIFIPTRFDATYKIFLGNFYVSSLWRGGYDATKRFGLRTDKWIELTKCIYLVYLNLPCSRNVRYKPFHDECLKVYVSICYVFNYAIVNS
jgi:hypothetical protein